MSHISTFQSHGLEDTSECAYYELGRTKYY